MGILISILLWFSSRMREAAFKDAAGRLQAKQFESDFNYYEERFLCNFDLDLDPNDYVLLEMQIICPYEYCEVRLTKAAHASVVQTTSLELTEPLNSAFEKDILPNF